MNQRILISENDLTHGIVRTLTAEILALLRHACNQFLAGLTTGDLTRIVLDSARLGDLSAIPLHLNDKRFQFCSSRIDPSRQSGWASAQYYNIIHDVCSPFLARTCGNRTHPGRDPRPTPVLKTGGHTSYPSAPMNSKTTLLKELFVERCRAPQAVCHRLHSGTCSSNLTHPSLSGKRCSHGSTRIRTSA